jgi:hypothetical protein
MAEKVIDYLYDVEKRWIGETTDSDGDQIVLEFEKDVSAGGLSQVSFDDTETVAFTSSTDSAMILTVSDLSHRYFWLANAVDQLMADEQLQSSCTESDGRASRSTAENPAITHYSQTLITPGTKMGAAHCTL